MADKTLYNYELKFEDGSADGINERGSGDEKAVEAAIEKRWNNAFYETVEGGWDVYTSEDEAGDPARKLGEVREAKE